MNERKQLHFNRMRNAHIENQSSPSTGQNKPCTEYRVQKQNTKVSC